MNYKQLDDKKKAQIDILLESGNSMRSVGKLMKISHSTISRYKNNIYTKREIKVKLIELLISTFFIKDNNPIFAIL